MEPLSKASGVSKQMWNVRLEARVFEEEESAIEAVRNRSICPGTCIVIRNEGTKGGPGNAGDAWRHLGGHGGRDWENVVLW